MNARELWSRLLITIGSIAMLVGALDPMEGSLVILPGSGLVKLGTFLSNSGRGLLVDWLWIFGLIAVGVGALWELPSFGVDSGRSMRWGVLILPYPIGWVIGITSLLFRSGRTVRHGSAARLAMHPTQARLRSLLFSVCLVTALTFTANSWAAQGAARESRPQEADRTRFEQIRAWADTGDAVAQYNLGVCYHNGDGVEQDEKEAVKWIRKAALQGNASAQLHLGLSLVNGHGAPTNVVEGAQWYRTAADQGEAQAQFNLGVCYRDGVGVRKDPTEAVVWFRKAAAQGSAEAQQSLGMAYSQGAGVPQDQAVAFRWFRRAAEQGDRYAQHDLGLCYGNGEGVVQNSAQAVEWFRKSAEQGHPAAEHDLGVCYATGKGVTKDEDEAIKWFRRAAEHGDANSQLRLGATLEVRGEWAEAARWYDKAASQGVARAQYGLAGCYVRGLGVTKDHVEAYKWLLLSSAGGVAESTNALKILERMMTPEQILEGRRRAGLQPQLPITLVGDHARIRPSEPR